jgi:hypothetical protein
MACEPRNIGASVRARLLDRARTAKTDFHILLTRYALERLLYRLSVSDLRTSDFATSPKAPHAAHAIDLGEDRRNVLNIAIDRRQQHATPDRTHAHFGACHAKFLWQTHRLTPAMFEQLRCPDC